MEKEKIILKYLSGEATEGELQQLQNWVKESVTNESELAELKNSYAMAASKLSGDLYKADFNLLINQFQNKGKKRYSISKYYKISASIFFPILLAITGFLVYQNFLSKEQPVYTEVIAPPKHNSQVLLSDGTQVWLSPESKLIYEQHFGEKIRKVKLEGEGYFEVAHDKKKPFVVETNNLDINVLGTSFNVESYTEDELVRVTLVRGSVGLVSKKLENQVALIPGDRFTFNLQENTASIEKVNTEIYRLVKDGLLIFKRNNLNEVCRKLERWFMVPIEYDGTGNTDLEFTAKFEDESLTQILKIVSETFPIDYYIKNNKVMITYKN
jgi:ferric-dicitrate binding protein FerR (iron transport regulator)